MITNEKGKILPFKIKTTMEAVNSLDEFYKKLYEYLIKIGDVEIVDSPKDNKIIQNILNSEAVLCDLN